jgi:hypothetical protein
MTRADIEASESEGKEQDSPELTSQRNLLYCPPDKNEMVKGPAVEGGKPGIASQEAAFTPPVKA